MFAFSSYLSNMLIFPLLSSVRTSHFKPANQRIQEAGHTLETSTKKRKTSATFESSWKGWTSVRALRERQPKEEAAGSQNLQRLLQERRLTGQLGNASHALVGHLYSLVQGESSQVSLKHHYSSDELWFILQTHDKHRWAWALTANTWSRHWAPKGSAAPAFGSSRSATWSSTLLCLFGVFCRLPQPAGRAGHSLSHGRRVSPCWWPTKFFPSNFE